MGQPELDQRFPVRRTAWVGPVWILRSPVANEGRGGASLAARASGRPARPLICHAWAVPGETTQNHAGRERGGGAVWVCGGAREAAVGCVRSCPVERMPAVAAVLLGPVSDAGVAGRQPTAATVRCARPAFHRQRRRRWPPEPTGSAGTGVLRPAPSSRRVNLAAMAVQFRPPPGVQAGSLHCGGSRNPRESEEIGLYPHEESHAGVTP